MNTSSIALLTTVANFDLYAKTAPLFPKGIPHYIIDRTNGMHGIHSIKYMIKKLKGKGIEWLIMADEDVIFYNPNSVFDIINEMKAKQMTVCGVRDGGSIAHRNKNPFVINTFFSILHFKGIEAMWNTKEMLKNQFCVPNEFQDDLARLPFDYDNTSLYEPYYCFYFWLRRKGKQFLFLEAVMDSDGISNKVVFNNKEILCHTWYARSYGENEKHTKRINRVVQKMPIVAVPKNSFPIQTKLYKKSTFALEQLVLKLYEKICRKLAK